MKKVSECNYRDHEKKNNGGMEWSNMKWGINKEWWWDGNEEEVNEHSLHFNTCSNGITSHLVYCGQL